MKRSDIINQNAQNELNRLNFLIRLGFIMNEKTGKWRHELLGTVDFDFSSNSIMGTIYAIYMTGYNNGVADNQRDIKKVLGI